MEKFLTARKVIAKMLAAFIELLPVKIECRQCIFPDGILVAVRSAKNAELEKDNQKDTDQGNHEHADWPTDQCLGQISDV